MAFRKDLTIGILGYGSLGRAIDSRLRYCGFQNRYASRKTLQYGNAEGIRIRTNAEVVGAADIFNICVKQANLRDVASETAGVSNGKLGVSFIAGVWLEDLEKIFGSRNKISRAMTSLAFSEGKAITAISYNKNLNGEERSLMEEYLSLGGDVIELDENKFDAFTAAYACAIGWVDNLKEVFATEDNLLRALENATESSGFNKSEAKLISRKVLDGYALSAEGMQRGEFYKRVASRGGMTEAGWNEFEKAAEEAVARCYKHAIDHGKQLREKAKEKVKA
ncbi:MAG TPA: pyrroline-5-carboxylate reductase dimerization domain-containing protein [archaeon]|nr:pyrroline-5-carboxylate reductase dimerization domain-containing protein [archaeon]